jgi:cyanuric acid amidohydrolase
MRANVFRLPMQHPGDLSELEGLIAQDALRADEIVAVIGKTEGNGGVNDFTRGYFTQSLMALLSRHLNEPSDSLIRRIPCILSGGTEGVLSPHYVVLCRGGEPLREPAAAAAFAIGTAISEAIPAEDIGRPAHAGHVADAVRKAMAQAHIARAGDVHFVQVKCPCVTSARAEAARAGAFGVALALGEIGESAVTDAALLQNFSVHSDRASISSGIEVEANEVIVLGNSPLWSGGLQIAHRPMSDALDIGAVVQVLADLDIAASPQVASQDRARVQAVFVKCEPDRRGHIRGQRHTMLDDTDINAQRHIRGAVGGLVAGVLGDTRIFVSGGAEHQGPDGGGLIAAIAERALPRHGAAPCAS